MEEKNLEVFEEVVDSQRNYFQTGALRSVSLRKELLEHLKNVVKLYEERLYDSIQEDFRKSSFETYSTELVFIYNEIDYFLKNLNKLAKPEKVKTNLLNQIGSSRIYSEAYGVSLIIGAWNYPYQLSFLPSICAIAAGNTVVLKPSEIPRNTAELIEEMISTHFPKEVFHVINGGIQETSSLLKLRFDKIFFTGSPQVGKIVYKAAAEHLTPVTLELGGKSPAIVTKSAQLDVAARRIVWGKFLNAGQTCIAPDYLYVHQDIKDDFLTELKHQIEQAQYVPDSENYTRIINEKNFDRILKLIDRKKVYYGGEANKENLYIQPTIMTGVLWEDKVMEEEIFGPVLPVLDYENLEDVFGMIRFKEKPLSAYIFTNNSKEKKKFTTHLSFGGGAINDTVMHISNPNLPFGGVGNSGMGSYHGKYGFEAFTHKKSVLDKAITGEPRIKYPPYTEKKKWLVKKVM